MTGTMGLSLLVKPPFGSVDQCIGVRPPSFLSAIHAVMAGLVPTIYFSPFADV